MNLHHLKKFVGNRLLEISIMSVPHAYKCTVNRQHRLSLLLQVATRETVNLGHMSMATYGLPHQQQVAETGNVSRYLVTLETAKVSMCSICAVIYLSVLMDR